MATRVSKNAREGVSRKSRVPTCRCGVALVRVKVVPGFRGRTRLEWRHEGALSPVCTA